MPTKNEQRAQSWMTEAEAPPTCAGPSRRLLIGQDSTRSENPSSTGSGLPREPRHGERPRRGAWAAPARQAPAAHGPPAQRVGENILRVEDHDGNAVHCLGSV